MTRVAVWFAAAALCAGAGCASTKAAQQREARLLTQMEAARYQKALDEVWGEVRRMLYDQGYALIGKDMEALGREAPSGLLMAFTPAKETQPLGPDGRFLETGWGRGLVRRRYRVEGTEQGGRCRVTFTAIREDLTEHGRDAQRERDLEMELMLAWRVDRDLAARIEAAVDPEAK